MSKRIIFIVLGLMVLAVIVFGLWYWSKISQDNTGSQGINKNAELILFYGAECPHCKDLEKFIAENNVKSKINFEELEVFHDRKAGEFLLEKAKECGIDEKIVVVPFFYARGKCLTGTPDIEEFLRKEGKV